MIKKLLLWLISFVLAVFAIASFDIGYEAVSVFMILLIAMIIPIGAWQAVLKKHIGKKLKVIITIIFAFMSVFSMGYKDLPTDTSTDVSDEPVIIETESTATAEVSPLPTPDATQPPSPEPTPTASFEPTPVPTPDPTAVPTASVTPKPTTASKATPSPSPTAKATPSPTPTAVITPTPEATYDYVLNTNTKKFHKPSCGSVKQIKDKNRSDYHGTRSDIIDRGYSPCGKCHP